MARVRGGMTIIELLVVIVILSLLFSLLIPSLMAAKESASQLGCISNIRSAGLLLTNFSNQNDSRFVFPGRVSHRVPLWNEKWIDIGGADIGPGAWWTAMFREEWQGSNWNAAYRCPSQPEYTPGAASLLEGKHALSSYWMSTSISVDGTKLEAGCEPYRDAPVVQNRRDAVSYPSSKVELYEAIGFCLKADKNVAEWIDRGQTMQYQTSALMADGSAGRYRRNDYADTSIGNTPFDYTINGIYGRDIVRGLSGTSVFR